MAPGREAMFWLFAALLLLAWLVLNVALGYGGMLPDFLTVAVLLGARRANPPLAALLGLAAGLLADALALTSFGASGVALVVVAYLGARSRDLFEGGSLLFVAVYLFLGKWLADAIYVLAAPTARPHGFTAALLGMMPLRAAYTALAGALALAGYRAVVGERRGA